MVLPKEVLVLSTVNQSAVKMQQQQLDGITRSKPLDRNQHQHHALEESELQTPADGIRWRGFVAGSASGITKVILGFPLDTVKILLQSSEPGTYPKPELYNCFKQTINKNGFLGLYKGSSVPFVGWAMTDSAMLGTLHNLRHHLFTQPNGRFQETDEAGNKRLTLSGHFLAGMGAGLVVLPFSHPIDRIKTKLQSQLHLPGNALTRLQHHYLATYFLPTSMLPPPPLKGPISAFHAIVREGGYISLYRGLLWGSVVRGGLGIMFVSYESFFRFWSDHHMGLTQKTILSSLPASLVFWSVVLPFDNLKNRVLTRGADSYKTTLEPVREIFAEGGVRAFWRGAGPTILRAGGVNAVALMVWEGVMKVLGEGRVG